MSTKNMWVAVAVALLAVGPGCAMEIDDLGDEVGAAEAAQVPCLTDWEWWQCVSACTEATGAGEDPYNDELNAHRDQCIDICNSYPGCGSGSITSEPAAPSTPSAPSGGRELGTP